MFIKLDPHFDDKLIIMMNEALYGLKIPLSYWSTREEITKVCFTTSKKLRDNQLSSIAQKKKKNKAAKIQERQPVKLMSFSLFN